MPKCVCIGRKPNDYAEFCAIRDMLGKEPIRKLPEPLNGTSSLSSEGAKFSKGNMYCTNYFKCTCCHKWCEIYDDIDENYMCISCSKNKTT